MIGRSYMAIRSGYDAGANPLHGYFDELGRSERAIRESPISLYAACAAVTLVRSIVRLTSLRPSGPHPLGDFSADALRVWNEVTAS